MHTSHSTTQTSGKIKFNFLFWYSKHFHWNFKCPNGGFGVFCCTNGANNADCCVNGGRGKSQANIFRNRFWEKSLQENTVVWMERIIQLAKGLLCLQEQLQQPWRQPSSRGQRIFRNQQSRQREFLMSLKPTLTDHPRHTISRTNGHTDRGRETRDKAPSPTRQPRLQNMPTMARVNNSSTQEKTTIQFSDKLLSRIVQLS